MTSLRLPASPKILVVALRRLGDVLLTTPLPANWIAAALAAVSLLFCGIGVARNYSPIPVPDHWIGVYEFALNVHDGDMGAWWRPYLEDRPLLPRILFWLDFNLFSGNALVLLAFNLLLLALVWVILRVVWRRVDQSNVFFASCLSCAVTFAWMQGSNLYSGFAGSLWFMACLYPLAAFYCLYRSDKGSRWFVAAALLGVAAVWTTAVGLLALPAMTVVSVLGKFGWRRTALLAVLSAICFAAYFLGFKFPVRLGHNPIQVALLTLTFLGGPFFWVVFSWSAGLGHLWSVLAGESGLLEIGSSVQLHPAAVHIGFFVAAIAGFVFIAMSTFLLWQEAKGLFADRLQCCLLGFISFVVLSAGAIAFGRSIAGLQQLNQENYQTLVLLGWQVLAIAAVKSKLKFDGRMLMVAALAVALLPSELQALKSHRAEYEKKQPLWRLLKRVTRQRKN